MTHPMEDRLRQLKDRADTIRMTADEKAGIRSRLSAYMTMRPLRGDAASQPAKQVRGIFRLSPKLMPFFAVFLSLLLAGGGVSYAAERTVPGDVLYPVKVHVNEGVRAALAVNDESKAEWEAERVERRLDEARALLESKDIPSERFDDLEERFAEHEERVEATIDRIEEKKGSEFAVRFSSHLEASLAAHQAILDRLAKEADEDRAGRFAERVDQARERAKENRERMERGGDRRSDRR